jgi:putative Mg2+ transporter-C (MgtC) family protein
MLNTGLGLLDPNDWLGVLGRIGLALLVGGLIGFERELDHKPAGLRTHMLVSLGAALFVMTSIQTGMVKAEPNTLSRIMQGLITGIGFLGGGEIFSTAQVNPDTVRIQGLTSASAIWVSAALGTAAGCGLWFMSLTGATITVVILRVVKKLEIRIKRDRQ